MSIQSQDNCFHQPENVNVTKRESNLKIGVNRITKTAAGGGGAKSPFVVPSTIQSTNAHGAITSPVNSNAGAAADHQPYSINTPPML